MNFYYTLCLSYFLFCVNAEVRECVWMYGWWGEGCKLVCLLFCMAHNENYVWTCGA